MRLRGRGFDVGVVDPRDATGTRFDRRRFAGGAARGFVAAAAATGRCRVVARATRDDPPLRDLDVLATSAAVELGECAEATPQFLATRHFAFRSVDAAVVEDFGAACGSHVWNAGRKRVIQRRFNVSVPRARVSKTAPTRRERSER